MSGVTRGQVLSLYRRILRSGAQYKDYNYRNFALRRTRDQFEASRSLTDAAEIEKVYTRGLEQAAVVERQQIVQNLYFQGPSVMELTKNR